MSSLKYLLCLFFLAIVTCSCDPEEISEIPVGHKENLTAGTDDQAGDEVVKSRKNKTDKPD